MKGSPLFLLLLLFPALAIAGGTPAPSSSVGAFSVSPSDMSMQYLGYVLGPIGSLPIPSQGSPLFSHLVYIFNEIVFGLGLLIISYTGIIGLINTAHEGEALGKQWNPVIIPARVGIGMYLLVPTVGGYNWIQVAVMWFIIQGVGAANALWTKAVQFSYGLDGGQTLATFKNTTQVLQAIFEAEICAQALNNNLGQPNPMAGETLASDFLGEPIVLYRSSDGGEARWGRPNQTVPDSVCGMIPPLHR